MQDSEYRVLLWLKHFGLSVALLVFVSGMVIDLIERDGWSYITYFALAALMLVLLTLPSRR